MTPDTLRFLRDLVGRQQISADAPNVIELASMVWAVRQELDEAILEAEQ